MRDRRRATALPQKPAASGGFFSRAVVGLHGMLAG
jgi:hypothetical protein